MLNCPCPWTSHENIFKDQAMKRSSKKEDPDLELDEVNC
jgi:hypothetical protein